MTAEQVSAGYATFSRYAFPPNELGYCGPADIPRSELGGHAREFDGAWPYLKAIAETAGIDDAMDAEVVRSYWVGGPMLDRVDSTELLARLRKAFTGQLTGALTDVTGALAHHSFHVFVVYPWVAFLDRDPVTPVKVMQDCRIRWGTVDSIEDEHAVVVSQPLTYVDRTLRLDEPEAEKVRWSKDGVSLISAPVPGDTVSAHWDWVCATLRDDEVDALATATQATLDLVNDARRFLP
jgi:hypothetical protein